MSTAKSSIDGSTSSVTGSAKKNGVDVSTNVQDYSLNFGDMKSALGGAPITLSFGGLDWTVVYATTNTTAGTNTQVGDLIVTLWLNDNITTSKWSAATPSTNMNDYPTSMYSSSFIRVSTLNAGGDDGSKAGNTGTDGKTYYATSTTSRSSAVQLTDRKTNQFAKFTLSNSVLTTTENRTDENGNPITVTINPSLVDFLTAPGNVEYQRAENFVWAYTGTSSANLLPNEAWGKGANGPDTSIKHQPSSGSASGGWFTGTTGGSSNMSLMPGKNAYCEWSEDYLWLPSLTETGYYASNNERGASLWGIDNSDAIIKSTAPTASGATNVSWLRSGRPGDASYIHGLNSAGSSFGVSASAVGGVRPALHLNLSAAEVSAAMPDPQDTTLTYNGAGQDVKSEEWYDSDFFDDTSICSSIKYTDDSGISLPSSSPLPKEAGEYKAIFTLTNTFSYKWLGTASKKKTINFTIEPKKLAVDFEIDSTTKTPKVTLIDQPYTGDTVNATIHYYDSTGTKDEGTDILDLKGKTKYQAEVEFDNPNYEPDYETDNETNNKRLDFTNPATPVNVSWLSPTTGSLVFNGSARGFVLGFDPSLVQVSLTQDAKNAGASFDGTDTFTATNAGTYAVELELVNDQDYVWGADMGDAKGTTDDTTIEFTITPKELELTVNSVTPSDWSVYQGGSGTFTFQLPNVPTSVGTLAVVIYAQLPESASQKVISAPITLTTSVQLGQAVQFNTSSIIALGTYDLGVKIANSGDPNAENFTYKLDKPYTLTIKESVSSGDIVWNLYADGVPAGSMMTSDTKPSDTYNKKITYDGKVYSFTATPYGYTVDTTYGTDGYKTVKASDKSTVTDVKSAGTYVTTVRLSDGSTKYEFSIEWTIDKVVFDLSEVHWLEDGQLSFNEKTMGGNGLLVGLDPKTVPEGLIPQYSGVRTAKNVTDKGTAYVTFDVKDKVNYTIPQQGVAGSYIFNDTRPDFDWSMNWEVFETEIPVDWTVGTIVLKNDNNKKINGEVLAGGFDEYVEYEYYETDSTGNKLDPTNPLTEPQITDGSIRYYVAVAKIKTNYVGSYKFDPTATAADLESPVFEAGNALTGVTLAASKTQYIYWGEPVNFQFTITSGMIEKSAFDIVYYHGMVRLIGAPTDPGTYSAYISLKSEFEKSYYIDGTSSFDFTIGCATITEKWNDSVKPSVLNLTQNESLYVSYEYCDDKGNLVRINDLRTPGNYSVRAIISDSTKYIFDNNSDTTGWHKFTVNAWDDVPSSSLPPFKDPVNPNDPNGGGTTSDDKNVSFSLMAPSGAQGQQAQFSNNRGLTSDDYKLEYYWADYTLTDCNDPQVAWVKVVLQGDAASRYTLEKEWFPYIILNGNGGAGTTNPDGEGNNPSDWTIEDILPIILSGISLVLIVVFAVMAFNNASAAKEARAKTKKLATITYSFAPASLLMLFGLSYTNWWIVAGVLMGLALLTAIAAFMFKSKKKKAFAALSDEEARIAEEKEIAREEKEMAREAERDRRDNELRMMFASMQQNYQQPPQGQQLIDYDMLQNMITSSVSALLPAMQQQMQALPPASFDVNASMSAEAQKEIDGLHAQIAEQQEMLAQILQNQQNYVMPLYEEQVEDDTSWLGVSEERISLEESYGALSDEGKRFYYEIGSYIMNKPRTSQNDGRYAVLFKYRGRTVFKLCIKDDAPVLYYPEGNGRAEVRISSASSLEVAKSMIDRQTIKVDNELN